MTVGFEGPHRQTQSDGPGELSAPGRLREPNSYRCFHVVLRLCSGGRGYAGSLVERRGAREGIESGAEKKLSPRLLAYERCDRKGLRSGAGEGGVSAAGTPGVGRNGGRGGIL